MARQTPVLVKSYPGDAQHAANTVVVASGSNAGNVALPAAAGAQPIIGVTAQKFDANNYGPVSQYGIVQCRSLTGTAIAFGDKVKAADTAGRVTKLTPAAAGAGTLKGVVGVAMGAVASGDATDTLIDVLLTPGVALYE